MSLSLVPVSWPVAVKCSLTCCFHGFLHHSIPLKLLHNFSLLISPCAHIISISLFLVLYSSFLSLHLFITLSLDTSSLLVTAGIYSIPVSVNQHILHLPHEMPCLNCVAVLMLDMLQRLFTFFIGILYQHSLSLSTSILSSQVFLLISLLQLCYLMCHWGKKTFLMLYDLHYCFCFLCWWIPPLIILTYAGQQKCTTLFRFLCS